MLPPKSMTKNFTPKILRLLFLLIFVFSSNGFLHNVNLPRIFLDKSLNNISTNTKELARVNTVNKYTKNLTFENSIQISQILGDLTQITKGSEYPVLRHAGCNIDVWSRTVPSLVKTGSDQGSFNNANPDNNFNIKYSLFPIIGDGFLNRI